MKNKHDNKEDVFPDFKIHQIEVDYSKIPEYKPKVALDCLRYEHKISDKKEFYLGEYAPVAVHSCLRKDCTYKEEVRGE